MSDLYNYDPNVRQYRRAKDVDAREAGREEAPAAKAPASSPSDIYANSGQAQPEPSASFFDDSRPNELRNFHVGKFFAWIALLLMLAGWIYLIYLYLNDK